MGLIQKIFNGKKNQNATGAPGYTAITQPNPVAIDLNTDAYQAELTRAAIDRFATAASKLKPELYGTSKPNIARIFRTDPNEYTTWSRFLYRVATAFEMDSTVFIVPSFAWDAQTVTGLWLLKSAVTDVVEYNGEPWLLFHLANGEVMPIEMSSVCILSKYQYISDFFGDGNCLDSTLKLIDAQTKAQVNAIEMGASIRFIGSLTGQVHEDDMEEKRKRFVKNNLSSENSGGIMLYDQTFQDVKQVVQEGYTIPTAEMERIEQNVCTYYGTNMAILHNEYDENQWAAYYEGKVEPFAVQLGDGLNKMLFSPRERLTNSVSFSSNRLQYTSVSSKRQLIDDMMDRGVFTLNQSLEVLNMPQVDDGDRRFIRGEYKDISDLSKADELGAVSQDVDEGADNDDGEDSEDSNAD